MRSMGPLTTDINRNRQKPLPPFSPPSIPPTCISRLFMKSSSSPTTGAGLRIVAKPGRASITAASPLALERMRALGCSRSAATSLKWMNLGLRKGVQSGGHFWVGRE